MARWGAVLTGTGSVMFGLFADGAAAERARAALGTADAVDGAGAALRSGIKKRKNPSIIALICSG